MDDTRSTGARPSPLLVGRRWRDLTPRQRWVGLALAALLAGTFLLAGLQAYADDWYPIGDNGTMLTVTRQVFSSETPVAGEVASGTRYGAHPFHPGPLVYYVLAPFVSVFGDTLGMLLGAAFVSAGALVAIGYTALRTGGPGAALWAWVTAVAMCWSLGGTAFLYPPFKTTLSLLVIVLFLHLCAALVAGHSRLLPLWAVTTSFPIAATMRYALPVAAIAGVTVLAVAVLRWRRLAGPRGETPVGPRIRRVLHLEGSERRSVTLALALLAVAWWAPVFDALTNAGGNVRELYRASRTAAQQVDGLEKAIGEQAKALVFDPVQSAADFHASSTPYVVVAGLLLASVTFLVFRYRRHLGRAVWANVTIAAAALVFMLASLATTPSDEGIGIYRTLAASPVATFVVFSSGLVAAVALGRRFLDAQRVLQPVAVGAVVLGAVAMAVPGPIDASTEQYPFAFEATRQLVDQTAPRIEGDGRWATWVVGGRTTPTILVGLKAGLEAAGIDTGVDAGAPAIGAEDGRDPAPTVGNLLVIGSELPAPTDDWEVVATYEPEGRSAEEAASAAAALVEFAQETNPRPLPAFTGTLARLLCPEQADQGYSEECPEADAILASDNPVAELPPAAVALVYLVQFGEDTQYPVIDGPRPPDALLEAAAASWDDLPLSVYVKRIPPA
ncbi:MAG: hypothetical protein JNK12_11985 [Acidimicrobiales bacterium]|nr:hypothetical protein [Acidimicrobiales bacterium]